ncbi:hypothetical protein FEM48_Zijuj01G0010700 [Ziziphus jujuba var. spinosa]|uniref:Uncharacterized protein n=1 Tax=Ziziphus jujuba var. spinosa TaxID=714518 RepID=A0A978VY89_ZIZJJ|nr:hypothetical protein FEM48_Zijuj01G0010700 [Ziziphus jujuba var. spinosa]
MSSAIFQDTYNRDPFYDSQQKVEDDFSSTMRWAVVGSVVSGLVMTIAIVAIVYAIIDCLKKAGTAIPSYARIATRDSDITEEKASNPVNFSSNNEVKIGITPDFPVISESQVEFATMERFLSNMAREKPVSLSESRTWLPRWTWEMYENNELPVMLSLCGITEKDRDKAEKMAMVALLCIQYLPEARPLMSNVVQMLEGSKEITPPSFPFQQHSPIPNITGGSETNSEWNTSSGTTISKQIQSNRGSQAICEIELAGL